MIPNCFSASVTLALEAMAMPARTSTNAPMTILSVKMDTVSITLGHFDANVKWASCILTKITSKLVWI